MRSWTSRERPEIPSRRARSIQAAALGLGFGQEPRRQRPHDAPSRPEARSMSARLRSVCDIGRWPTTSPGEQELRAVLSR